MAPTTKEGQRAELHKTIWRIANDLRGSVDGWDFKSYVLGMLFYRFVSENLTAYVNRGEHEAGNADFDYPIMPDGDAEVAKAELVAGNRAIFAWPDCQHLKDIWGVEMDALAVIEWNESETAGWIEEANPVHLFADRVVEPAEPTGLKQPVEPLPNGVDEVLEYLAMTAQEIGSDMEWHEEQKLKADMMHRPDRWASVTVKQVRERSRALGMSPNDVDKICGYLQRRKDGRRFVVDRSYRGFAFR